jgi:hypothetical protein
MSNNKQSMKLYTKEDFLKAADFCEVSMIDARYIISRIDEVTDPIQLPSDEEIEKESLKTDFEYTFRNGAMWMRNKIGGGNNEN